MHIHSRQQVDRTGGGEENAENQCRTGPQTARRQRTILGAAHFGVCFALPPLVERARACGQQGGPDDGVDQENERKDPDVPI